MIADEKVIMIRCDSCGSLARGVTFDFDGEPDDEPIWHWPSRWEDIEKNLALIIEPLGWTHNGEGTAHCSACPNLELTQEAKEEQRRAIERSGLALFELEGTTP